MADVAITGWPIVSVMDEESALAHRRELQDQVHILRGLVAAQERWPDVSALAFEADSFDSLVDALVELLGADSIQALAISVMQVRRVGRLERDVLRRRLAELEEELIQAESHLSD